MERTLQILLIASDGALASEVRSALAELPEDMRVVLHTEPDARRGIEHAVNRQPDAVLLELGTDVDEVRRMADEINRGPTVPTLAVFYRPQVLGGSDQSASVLIDLMRVGIQDFLRRPIATPELEEWIRRHFRVAAKERTSRGRVISFVGNKGGVGKSTLSLSVACLLAQKAPDRVLLLDASLQHGAMCDLLDLAPKANICDAARQIDRLDERLLRMLSVPHESGLRVLAAPANAIEAAPVDDRVLARILAVARQAFDYVVVDTFPLLDSVTVAILDVSDLVFVVLNDLVPAVLGTSELLGVLDRIGVSQERVRIVLNHSHSGFRGRLKDVDVAARLGSDIDFVVPFSGKVLAATNTGEPYVLRAPRWMGFGRAVRAVERAIHTWNAARPEALDPVPRGSDPATRLELAAASEGEPRVEVGTEADVLQPRRTP